MAIALKRILIFTLLIFCLSQQTAANNFIAQFKSTGSLSSSVISFSPGSTFYLLFHISMPANWHAYWKNPGDSGMPPSFKWSADNKFNFKNTLYPAPQRFVLGPLVNFGYAKDAYYLIPVTTQKSMPLRPYNIKLKADWLVCEKECIPQSGTFNVLVNANQQSIPSNQAKKIDGIFSKLPLHNTLNIHYNVNDNQLNLSIPAQSLKQDNITSVSFFPEQESIIKLLELPSWEMSNKEFIVSLTRDFASLPNTIKGVLQINANNGSSHFYSIEASQKQTITLHPFWQALLFALLGGIILNAMPCVFPILALKALSLSRASRASYQQHCKQGIYYTLGVLSCFSIIAIGLLILKSVGQQIGWGYQMQSPLLIAGLVYLFLLISLNLLGVFEFGARIAGAGQSLTQKSGFWGSFFTGALAAVVATPCTAPFMGSAIAYALMQPAIISFTVLLMLGFGMALPLLLISLIPSLGRLLPKPGQWMQTFKEVLAFPMLLSMVWLLWVLQQQVDSQDLLIVMVGLVITGFSLWCWPKLNKKVRLTRALMLTILVLLSSYPLYHISQVKSAKDNIQQSSSTFSENKLSELLQQKQVVFVNVTAAWCLTCKYNELTYLSTTKFHKFLTAHNIHYLKADWTNRNEKILAYLQSFHRSGVPLYVIYNHQGKTTVLPQILTDKILYTDLNRALQTSKETD